MKTLEKYKSFIELTFITAREDAGVESVKNITAEWLATFGIKNPQVIVTKYKGDICNLLNIDCFVDDSLNNINDVFNKTNGKCQCFIFDYPHNRKEHSEKIKRINSLRDFECYILSQLE